jgi:hypothetical protein
MREHRTPCRAGWLGALCLALAPAAAGAADVEGRLFMVRVDGKVAGECRLTYAAADGGSETTTGTASVRVRKVIGTYRYQFDGSEAWKGGRLQRLDARTNDDGKQMDLHAQAQATGLRVVANGEPSVVRADAWPTTYWRLPAPELRGQPLTLLDVDTGRPLSARLTVVATTRLMVAGQAVDCTHYRVGGQAQADLWYDARGRLVRQATLEDGHRTVLELHEMRRQ